MDRRLVFLAILAAAILAACGTDPRNQADAERTQALTEQDTLDRAQARNQAAAAGAINLQEKQALSAERIAAETRLIRWASIAGALAIAGAILATAAGVGWAAIGTGRAAARLASIRAGLIPLAESTRQYPLILSYVGRGKYTLCNPNSGGVYELDTQRPEVKQMITAAGAVAYAGVIAREARRSQDPAGVAIIQPAIIEGGEKWQ
jgi:hypothetical protein